MRLGRRRWRGQEGEAGGGGGTLWEGLGEMENAGGGRCGWWEGVRKGGRKARSSCPTPLVFGTPPIPRPRTAAKLGGVPPPPKERAEGALGG